MLKKDEINNICNFVRLLPSRKTFEEYLVSLEVADAFLSSIGCHFEFDCCNFIIVPTPIRCWYTVGQLKAIYDELRNSINRKIPLDKQQ